MNKPSLFKTVDGKNHFFTFALVTSLFLLWGFCNGMIDVMDKHFQEELKLSLSQSAWVQFAHYLGYFLMALPAGWLASKLGYKGGIIVGLLMVAVGGFWFIPATHIASFWAFLLGVCFIAAGLTFLETVANPYTTVLGPKNYAATRINLAQSFNGVGWVFGPIAGAMFFYSTDAQGQSTGAQTLWIPYAAVGVVVLILAVIFFRTEMPDIKSQDEYHLDEKETSKNSSVEGGANRKLALFVLWLNLVVLSASIGMIVTAIATIFDSDESHAVWIFTISSLTMLLLATGIFLARSEKITRRSIWTHPHFSSATFAQFFYVAAQAGIFGFFINYMGVSKTGVSQVPAIPLSWEVAMTHLAENAWLLQGWLTGWFKTGADGLLHISDKGAANLASVAFICFLVGRVIGAWLLKKYPAHRVLGLFATLNIGVCLLVFLKLGWVSVFCVFLSYFFMSIMFPTIFALGIHGLGARAKKASSFIVMAIMGGAIMPKLMGHIADHYDISRSFIVPLVCFGIVALYGFFWSMLSQSKGVVGVSPAKGH